MSIKAVLGFSGGLDTTFCVKWLQENGYVPICVTLDVGQEPDLSKLEKKAKLLGVEELRVINGVSQFADWFIRPSLMANGLYQGVYPLATALSRPYIAKVMADVAREVGTTVFVHGCTGKGNDQIRIETALRSIVPACTILAPVRDNNLSRGEEIEYLQQRGVSVESDEKKAFSIDQNIWGRSICAGSLEDIWQSPPEDAFEWTCSIQESPNDPEELLIEFEHGVPVAIDGHRMELHKLIDNINQKAGRHGVGRIDHIEDRTVGIKSREIYEAPAAVTLIKAHQAMETLTLSRASLSFKRHVEAEYANNVYAGNWFSRHTIDLLGYLELNQSTVTGEIRLTLYRGSCIVGGRRSKIGLYDPALATYGQNSTFNQAEAAGFVRLMGMESQIQAKKQLLNFTRQLELVKTLPQANEEFVP